MLCISNSEKEKKRWMKRKMRAGLAVKRSLLGDFCLFFSLFCYCSLYIEMSNCMIQPCVSLRGHLPPPPHIESTRVTLKRWGGRHDFRKVGRAKENYRLTIVQRTNLWVFILQEGRKMFLKVALFIFLPFGKVHDFLADTGSEEEGFIWIFYLYQALT